MNWPGTKVHSFSELQATVQSIDPTKLVVVYVDVAGLPPDEISKYMEIVADNLGKLGEAPDTTVYIPVRHKEEQGSRIESLPNGRKVAYVDVGDLPPGEVIHYINNVKKNYLRGLDCSVMPTNIEILDESEMNDRGWYYYGVKRDGTEVMKK